MRGKYLLGAAGAALLALGFAPAAVAQSSDPAGDASTQARLSVGQSVSGAFDAANDTDWYRVRVEQGQRYHFTLDGGEGVDPVIVLYGRDSAQLAFNDDAGGTLNSALDYTPAQTGEIFIEARSFDSEATGQYTLNVSASAAPADDAGNDATTRARASAGRTVTGALEYEGDVDVYRFSARTGETYTISLSGAQAGQISALNDPLLRIVDRSGAELASNDDSGDSLNSQVQFTPTRGGDVFIEARAYGDAAQGGYALSIQATRLPAENASADTNTRARVNVGQSVDGTIDYAADHDWFRIRLEGGQSYRFSLVSNGENALGDPVLMLYDARGEQLAGDDDGGEGFNSYLEFTAPTTGTYFLEARSFDESATGAYRLSARAGDTPADSSTELSLSADGDYFEGNLSPAGDRDWYKMTLEAGQNVRLSLMSAEGMADALADPMLVVYGADGQQLASDDDGGEGLNSWLEFEAPTAGTYFVEARGFVEDAAGRYVIGLTPGEIGNSADTAEAMTANSEGRMSRIGAAGDADWFSIDLVEGRPYRFNVQGMDPTPLADPVITLYDAQGQQVATDDDGGAGTNAYLTFMSPTGGPYYAAVSSYGDTGTGSYYIGVSDTDVPGNVNTDENLNAAEDQRLSRIDMPDDQDFYRVELEAGVSYAIEVSGAGQNPLADPFLTIYDESGQRLTSDDDSGDGLDARLRFTPETSGVFHIGASGLGGSTGWYQVTIVRR
ncbi:PPC domain-containing protein [Terricaulis sp.]|uniref:PPC domain-containing protein n=1 Tax=Terricaulis sp. TaxID=2768686 RepID=UPI00378466B5